MHIPMETLSFTATRTDSGSGVRKPSGSGIETGGSKFERMFEDELTRYDSNKTNKSPNPEKSEKDVRAVEKEDKDNTEETLAAGAMGTQNSDVINILEGEGKSITTPEMHVENNIQLPETDQLVNPDENGANPGINTKTFTIETPENAQTSATASAETAKTAANIEATVENNANATGEVLARMPEIRTHDSQNNAGHSSEFTGNGNLSPLENENDEPQVKGQSTYSEAADAVRSAAEDNAEIATNEILQPPPLSEGIKPEQFQATEKMTQAALNTPVRTENLFNEMISRVEMMQNETKSTMTIQLNPEFLGKVALEVAVDAAGLHVRINAEDSGVRSMINGQLATLIESLEHKGIEVVEVEVAYTGTNLGTYQDPREGGQQHSSRQYTANRGTSTAEQITFYTTMPELMDYYLDTGVSSVEYRA